MELIKINIFAALFDVYAEKIPHILILRENELKMYTI